QPAFGSSPAEANDDPGQNDDSQRLDYDQSGAPHRVIKQVNQEVVQPAVVHAAGRRIGEGFSAQRTPFLDEFAAGKVKPEIAIANGRGGKQESKAKGQEYQYAVAADQTMRRNHWHRLR